MILATDARVLNALTNHPDVKPHLTDDPDAELVQDALFTPECADRIRFFHSDDETVGALFNWTSPNVWEMHMQSLKPSRGLKTWHFMNAAIDEMFVNQGAKELWGQTKVSNEHARNMHGAIAVSQGIQMSPLGPVELFVLTKAEWERRKGDHL